MKKTICIILTLLLLTSVWVLCACHEHQFGEWSVTKEPTCTQDGEKTQTCECGEKKTQTIAAGATPLATGKTQRLQAARPTERNNALALLAERLNLNQLPQQAIKKGNG